MSATPRADQPDPDLLVTLRAVARRTGLGLRQLERACVQGDLAVFRVGGWRRVRWADVETWLARQREPTMQGRTPMPWVLRAATSYLDELGGDIHMARAALDILEARP